MNTADQHATALAIVHEEAGRTLSKHDFDMCMRIAKRALASDAAQAPVAVIGSGWQLLYASREDLATIVERHGLKIGAKLYAAPTASESIEPSEREKMMLDAVTHGQGFMKDGKHVPLDQVRAQPASFSYHEASEIAFDVMEQYKADHPKWWKRMDGTPILNDLPVRMATAFSEARASAPQATGYEVTRLREIARLIGSIFVHGDFKAETHNERELEKLLREQGCFFESLADFDAGRASAPQAKFECAARKQGSVGGNDPADCDWPVCGCDEHANKVIGALEESGALKSTPIYQIGANAGGGIAWWDVDRDRYEREKKAGYMKTGIVYREAT